MTTITNEFQKSIATKIESAFINGSGHYFMQKNNFSDIIAVSEYFIEHYESKGYELFILDNCNRSNKPVAVNENNNFIPSKLVKSNCMVDAYYDEFPDAYNQNL